MEKEKRKQRYENRKNLHERFNKKCAYCGRDLAFSDMTIDHIVPLAKGGASCIENMLPACIQCNNRKGMLTVQGFRRSIQETLKKTLEIPVVGMLQAYGLIECSDKKVEFYFEKLYSECEEGEMYG